MQFSFEIDSEIHRVVTIEKVGRVVDVHVRFATDNVVERSDRFHAEGDISVNSENGVALSYLPRGSSGFRVPRTRRD